jgi:SAM-dependent methyltransferase
MNSQQRATARRLAQQSIAQGDAVGWFDALYRQAAGQPNAIPWADLQPNVSLVRWLNAHRVAGDRRNALVVGCGLGDDAEELVRRGFAVTAFDVSPTAIEWCGRRFPASMAKYVAADVLSPPAQWRHAFDFVVEIYTLQVLPAELRSQASQKIAECVAPGGKLFIMARGRHVGGDPGAMPWPLLKSEIEQFAEFDLVLESWEDFLDEEDPPVRRFLATFARPQAWPPGCEP